MKHTSGPWHVERAADGMNLWVGCERYTIATVMHVANEVNMGEMEANARLIAEAPAMLDTLRECVTEEGSVALSSPEYTERRLRYISRIARQMILQATGESQ